MKDGNKMILLADKTVLGSLVEFAKQIKAVTPHLSLCGKEV